MRKWLVVAGLAASILAIVLLVRAARQAPAAEPPAAAAYAPHGAAEPPPHAPPPHPGGVEQAGPAPSRSPAADETARLVAAYPVDMERLERYVMAVREVRAAGERDEALMDRLREPGPEGEGPTAMGARLEAIGPLKVILGRHGVAGLDLVLMPQAVMSGRTAYGAEQGGGPAPAEGVNASSLALFRKDPRTMEKVVRVFMADLKVLSGH